MLVLFRIQNTARKLYSVLHYFQQCYLVAGGGLPEFAFLMRSILESKICPMTSESSQLCSLAQEIIVGCMLVGSFPIKKVTKGAGVTLKREPIRYSKKVCISRF